MRKLVLLAAIVSSGVLLASAQNQASSKTPTAATNPIQCAKPTFPGHAWKKIFHATPDEWSLPKLAAARQYADSLHDSSVVIVQCGRVVDEWGDSSKKITTFSIRKSLISALYGIYSAEGKIDINETLEQAGVDDSPSPLTKVERQARIVDLLRARSGVYHAADFETDFQRKTRPVRGSHEPGTFWFYNNWDFNVLGTIFEKKTGLKIGDAFYERIAKPIGMQDFKPGDLYYVGSGEVSLHPAYMFEMTARDMARFGLLYLNHGRWKGHQIVPEAWVDKSTHAKEMVHLGHMDLGGYEYLWWVEYGGVHLAEATLPGMYSAQGAGGHLILVVPSLNVVIVNRYDNEPDAHDPKSVLQAAQDKHAMFDEQLAHLMKLILDARTPS
jgi:CubicO group peptidase (beta-lactamase class C family)